MNLPLYVMFCFFPQIRAWAKRLGLVKDSSESEGADVEVTRAIDLAELVDSMFEPMIKRLDQVCQLPFFLLLSFGS